MVSYLKNILKYTIQYACITHCFFEYVGEFVVCTGPSMEPTLYTNNILITERISARFHKTNRGDIVIAISPTNPEQYICKRVVGLPGDKVVMDKFTRDLHTAKKDDVGKTTVIITNPEINNYVPKGFVWIEGDNRQNSTDSRYYGPIPLGLIKSRAVCRIWPLNEIKIL